MGKVVKDIRVALTVEERSTLGNEIAEHVMRREALEERKRTLTSDLTSEIKNEQKAYRSKAKSLRDGHTFKPIDCEEILDFERNTVSVKRIDTGEFVGDPRAMRAEERQKSIDFPTPEGAAAPVVAPKEGGKRLRAVASPPKPDEAH